MTTIEFPAMHRLIPGALCLLWSATALGQAAPAGEEPEQAEVRRYSVELIVFAYAEDVATGSELFLPEIVEIERPVETGDDPWLLEGPVPDDSMPADGAETPEIPEQEAQAEEPALPDGVFRDADGNFVNEAGERVNEFGERIDGDGNLIEADDVYATVLFTEDELTMRDTYDRLDRLDAYEPLLHVGWAQAALPEAETEALTVESFGIPVDGLEGSFTLYLSRFLHLVVDLELAAVRGEEAEFGEGDEPRELSYEETVVRYGMAYDPRAGVGQPRPGPDPGGATDDWLAGEDDEERPDTVTMVMPLKYSISENRIFANGDVRYFDHPKFGVIARVDRVEIPEDTDRLGDDTDVLLPVGGQ